MTDQAVFELERLFKAPKELVWKTWTDPQLLAQWYGPNVETVIHQLDVEPGGLWLNEMKMGEHSHFQRTEYTEVTPYDKLVMLMSTSDANWSVTANPMMPDFPQTLLTKVSFDQQGSATKMRLTWEPHQATDAEIMCFAGAIDGLGQGWGAGMELLADLLSELQA